MQEAAGGGRQAGGSKQQAADVDWAWAYPGHTQNQEEAGRQEEAGSGQEAAGGWQAGGSRRRQMYPPVWHRINLPSSLVATWDLFLGAEGVASHQSSFVVGGYLVSVSGRRGCGIASITKKYCMGSLGQNCESGCLGVGYA